MSFYLILAIFACLGLAVAHFVYEEIIAPSLLMRLEIRLFALQDLAQTLKADRSHEFDDKSFELLNDSITTLLVLLPHINVSTVLRARRELAATEKLQEYQTTTDRTLDACPLLQVREIRDETRVIFKSALLINCAPLYGYSVLLIAPYCWLALIARQSGRLLSLPKRDIIKFLLH